MKNIRFLNYCLLLSVIIFSVACYKPVANTSGASGREDARNENTSVDNMKKTADEKSSENSETDMTKDIDSIKDLSPNARNFRENLSQNLERNGLKISEVNNSSSTVERRILAEYGSVFLTKAMPPPKTMFTNEQEVSAFQTKAKVARANIGGTNIELQPAALKALQNAVEDAKNQGLKITPRDGEEAARRSFQKTLTLWNSRLEPALKHWKSKGRLTDAEINNVKNLPIKEQVEKVLELEKQGIYFNTFFNNSILYSVAAPGTSQHLSMLAFDANEFGDKKVREILAKHGWFRTVQNDEPHFTYLGYKEDDLPKLGLKKVIKKDGEFWIPDI